MLIQFGVKTRILKIQMSSHYHFLQKYRITEGRKAVDNRVKTFFHVFNNPILVKMSKKNMNQNLELIET